MSGGQELWRPKPAQMKLCQMSEFMRGISSKHGIEIDDYRSLYNWSISEPEKFWDETWDFCRVIGEKGSSRVLVDRDKMPGAKFFPDAELNFAENLLRYRDEREALTFWGEDKARRRMTYAELHLHVARVAAGLRDLGIKPGDRVAALMPNMPETVIAMLAAASIGATFSSCSPDFGLPGILDRFGQIEPKVLFASDRYFHKGAEHDVLAKASEAAESIGSVEKLIIAAYSTPEKDLPAGGRYDWFHAFGDSAARGIKFERLPFNHPLYIMFSSGTTGKPKCITHGAGGTLLEHMKELVLHCDLKREDRIFYQTTCGWMMWNWLASSLAAGASLVLYDGAPFHRSGRILWDLAADESVSVFGTNAKYLAAIEKEGLEPANSHELPHLRLILSTGSPLMPESFDYVYRAVKQDVCLSSIAGGTDIIGCFALGCPLRPVHRGELQCRSLGLAVDVFDEDGKPVREQKGQLVCGAPFPSMPIGFWGDPDGARYKASYFEYFPGVWHHGDYVELSSHDGMIFYGRSDAVLNPGGIRIGTAEIYNQVEQLPEVLESLVVAQSWQNDERVVLFVRLKEGQPLDDDMRERIRQQIRRNTTAFHVPKVIVQVSDIPRTRSGKIVELAVKNLIHGLPVKNIEALANPESLEQFRDLPELKI